MRYFQEDDVRRMLQNAVSLVDAEENIGNIPVVRDVDVCQEFAGRIARTFCGECDKLFGTKCLSTETCHALHRREFYVIQAELERMEEGYQ